MEQTSGDRLLSTEDVVLKILYGVSTDVAALFRCGLACKRWRALVGDHSFLRRCWPENRSTLLGFFMQQRMVADIRSPYRLFFVPPPAGSVLGAQRRLLTSMVEGMQHNDLQLAKPFAARGGLLLLRLISESVPTAVCDLFTRKCHVLPPLQCRVSLSNPSARVSCSILSRADCRHHQPSMDYFKVLAIVLFNNPKNKNHQECNLYTFSSTKSRWSAPTKCFNDDIYRLGKCGFQFPQSTNSDVVHGGVVHWLLSSFDEEQDSLKYYTLDINTVTAHTSLMQLPVMTNVTTYFDSNPALGVTTDGSLTLFRVHIEAHIQRLHMWKRNGIDNEVWLHTRVIELNLPMALRNLVSVRILPMEKSNTLFIIDENPCVYKIDVQTGMVEELQFQNALSTLAVPMNIQWLTWFASRLGYVLESDI